MQLNKKIGRNNSLGPNVLGVMMSMGVYGQISLGDVRDKVSHVCSYWMMCWIWFLRKLFP